MNLAVIGTGYVGLVSGVCLASRGHQVTCVDKRSEVVERINRGEPPIHEEGLPELLRSEIQETKRLRATLDLAEAIAGADMILVAVGTPSDEQGRMDSTYLEAAVREIGEIFKKTGKQIPLVIKSTVLPGTTDTMVAGWLSESSGVPAGELQLGMNPEFLREGQAIRDFQEPDRIVFGHEDSHTRDCLAELYESFPCEKVETNTRTAEMIKYANNALLALQISASNELANLATAMGGVDIAEVLKGVYLDHRWNPVQPDGKRANPQILTYLKPGCGFGGSCFPKDVSALKNRGKELGLPMAIWEAVLEVNRLQPYEVARILDRNLGKGWEKRKVGVLGLAFKPGTDDVRESASLLILKDLVKRGASVQVHDPVAMAPAREQMGAAPLEWVEDWKEIIASSEIIIIATAWPDYGNLPHLLSSCSERVVVDPRRMFSSDQFYGHRYLSIGLNPQSPK